MKKLMLLILALAPMAMQAMFAKSQSIPALYKVPNKMY